MKPDSTQPRLPMKRFHALLKSRTFVLTAWASGWQFVRLACQVVILVLLARSLGPSDYGIFAGSAGLATALAGLTGLGMGMVLVKDVAATPRLWDSAWRRALNATLLSGTLLTAAFTIVAPPILDIDAGVRTMFSIAVADLLCFPITYLCGFAFQAFHRVGWAAALPTAMAVIRMAGAVAFLTTNHRNLQSYAIFHLASSSIAALLALSAVAWQLRPRRPGVREELTSYGEALRFCATWFTNNALGEFDKTLAVRFGAPAVAAIYAIAYRLGSALATPVTALVMSTQPLLFASAQDARWRLAAKALAATIILGAVASIGMVIVAPILPSVLGAAYENVRPVAWMMTLFPLAFSLRFTVGSLLTAEGRPGLRAIYEALGVVIMSILAALLIPRWGARGMVAMTLIAEAVVLLLGISTLAALRRRALAVEATAS